MGMSDTKILQECCWKLFKGQGLSLLGFYNQRSDSPFLFADTIKRRLPFSHQLFTACSAKEITLPIFRTVPSSSTAVPEKRPNIWWQ